MITKEGNKEAQTLEEKAQRAGFTIPAPKPTAAPIAAPPITPAVPKENPLKSLEGVIGFLDLAKRELMFKTEEFSVKIEWVAYLDEKMAKFKGGYKAKVTYEHSGDTNTLIDIISLFKPSTGGKGNYQPRNERIIVLQSCAKLAAEVWIAAETEKEFDAAMDLIIARAIKDADTLMKAGV